MFCDQDMKIGFIPNGIFQAITYIFMSFCLNYLSFSKLSADLLHMQEVKAADSSNSPKTRVSDDLISS